MLRFVLLVALFVCQCTFAATISPRTFNALNDLQKQITEQPTQEQQQEIEEALLELTDDLEGNSLGLALTYQTHAQLKTYQQKEDRAQALLQKAIQLPDLKIDTLNQLRSLLAFSYFGQAKYKASIEPLKLVIRDAETPSANIYALLAASYYSLEEIAKGLPYIEKACELSDKPKEAWLQMAFAGNYQTKQHDKAIFYVNQLVYNFPEKKDYWQQKAGVHQILEDYKTAANTKELFYKKGFAEKESDFINLGQLLASQGDAYKVAKLLEKALKNQLIEPTQKILNLQFQAWLQAKELSSARAALATLYDTYGETDDGYQLLQYYIDAESWQRADKLAQKLLTHTLTPKQKGKVLLYQGMVQYRLGDERKALKLLGKATAFESTSSQAKSWMSYIKQMGA